MDRQTKDKENSYKSRLLETPAERLKRNMKETEAKAKSRKSETYSEKMKLNNLNKESMKKLSKLETPVEKLNRNLRVKESTSKARDLETPQDKLNRNLKDKESTSKARGLETPQDKFNRNLKVKESTLKSRVNARAMPSNMYEGRNAQKVLHGEQFVPDLEHSKDRIGNMNIECSECGALKWKTETATLCCNNGKVKLKPFPDPPVYLKQLWTADTIEARLFREQSRPFNNALALSSIKVTER